MNPYLSDFMFSLPSCEIWLDFLEALLEYPQQYSDFVIASRLRKEGDFIYES